MALKATLGLFAGLTLLFPIVQAEGVESAWKFRVVQVRKASSHLLEPGPPSGVQIQVVRPLVVEAQPDVADRSYVVQIRLVNSSSTLQTLRWDLAEMPYLALPDGKIIRPSGHRVFGLSDNALATNGVLDVGVPSGMFFQLYPLFFARRLPAGTRLVIDRVGSVRVRLRAGRWSH